MNEHIIERRTHARHRVFKGGRLAFRDGHAIDCTVRNISPGGARLDVAAAAGLPDHFTLCIDSDSCGTAIRSGATTSKSASHSIRAL